MGTDKTRGRPLSEGPRRNSGWSAAPAGVRAPAAPGSLAGDKGAPGAGGTVRCAAGQRTWPVDAHPGTEPAQPGQAALAM